jgi:excisionase family DNA binding protein
MGRRTLSTAGIEQEASLIRAGAGQLVPALKLTAERATPMDATKETAAKQWLSVREVAEYLGLKPATIYQYVSERRIPYHKVPGSQLVKFKASEVDEWMEKGRVETKAEYLIRIAKKGGSDGKVAQTERQR